MSDSPCTKEDWLWDSFLRSLSQDDVFIGVRILIQMQQHKDKADRKSQKHLA